VHDAERWVALTTFDLADIANIQPTGVRLIRKKK
jgi:hypothetical protein